MLGLLAGLHDPSKRAALINLLNILPRGFAEQSSIDERVYSEQAYVIQLLNLLTTCGAFCLFVLAVAM